MHWVGRLILTTITLSIIHLSKTEDCVLDHRTREYSYEQDVSRHIRCHYDLFMQRVDANDTEVDVSVRFIMRYFALDDEDDVFRTDIWIILSWKDTRLAWNPEDYGGVKSILTHFVFIPVILVNTAYGDDIAYFKLLQCKVKFDGVVSCMSPVFYQASCITKLNKWPYDKQTCFLEFIPWMTSRNKVNLHFDDSPISMVTAAYGSQWTITEFEKEENVSPEVQLRLIFTMEREAAGLGAIIIYPSVILSVLTLSCLVLDVRNNIRLSLLCFSLFNHFYFLTELGFTIPKRSETTPTILLFYRGSMILTSLAVLVTCTLSYLCTKETTPPAWVQSCNQLVSTSVPRLVWPRWDTEHANVREWTSFANIVNSACIIVYLIAYVSMYVAFVPQPIPLNI